MIGCNLTFLPVYVYRLVVFLFKRCLEPVFLSFLLVEILGFQVNGDAAPECHHCRKANDENKGNDKRYSSCCGKAVRNDRVRKIGYEHPQLYCNSSPRNAEVGGKCQASG